jgi:hypothetical protein
MANRIIVATLYQAPTTPPTCLLNVTPRDLVVFENGDQIFLTVNLDSSVASGRGPISCSIAWAKGSSGPFGAAPTLPTALSTPTSLGFLSTEQGSSVTFEYTLTITYDNVTYIEDPQMQINA